MNRISGPPTMVGDTLQVPTADHGVLVLRPIGPEDTWPVFPGNLTAWEAVRQGKDVQGAPSRTERNITAPNAGPSPSG